MGDAIPLSAEGGGDTLGTILVPKAKIDLPPQLQIWNQAGQEGFLLGAAAGHCPAGCEQ